MKKFLLSCFLLLALTLGAAFAQKPINVGVMLPLKSTEGVESPRAIDFYRGLVMSMDSLKKRGISFRVYTYNTAKTPINTILDDSIIPYLDIIFGPDDNTTLKVISDFTSPRGTKVVDAFAPSCDAVTTNPHFYVAYAPNSVVTDDAAKLLKSYMGDKKYQVIVLTTGQPTHALVPSFKQNFKKFRLQAMSAKLTSRLSKSKVNFIAVASSDKESAQALIDMASQLDPRYDVRLLGYPEWQDYELPLSKVETYVFTPYYNEALAPLNQSFSSQYRHFFHKDMNQQRPVMAMFGFDCGYYMLKALSQYGSQYVSQPLHVKPMQSNFSFQTYGISGGQMNHAVNWLHYKTDGKVELIHNTH